MSVAPSVAILSIDAKPEDIPAWENIFYEKMYGD